MMTNTFYNSEVDVSEGLDVDFTEIGGHHMGNSLLVRRCNEIERLIANVA